MIIAVLSICFFAQTQDIELSAKIANNAAGSVVEKSQELHVLILKI